MATPGVRSLGSAIEGHDNGFNLVRLVCALLVVVFHGYQLNTLRPATDPATLWLQPVTDLGGLAVAVFFLVSGIFITQSWMRDPHPGRYALRRAARIVPGLFACLLVTTVLACAFFSDHGPGTLLGAEPWRFIFGNTALHELRYIIPPEELRIPGVLAGQDLNGPLWTLYWEGRMYVMVALVGLSAALPLATWMRACALFLLLAANLFPEVAAGYVWEVRLWSMFLAGMLLQTVAAQLRVGALQVGCALALLALNWTRFGALTPSPLTWFGIALAAGALALWAGGARVRHIGHIQRHDYSYGVYIYHWPVLLMLRAVLPPLGALRLTLLAMAVTLALAALSWHLVEAPALRLARRWLGQHRRLIAAGPAPVSPPSGQADAAKKPQAAARIDADSA
ncbi:acyltransferase [Massilia solisilvae]|uniref:Acyltransferase n=1 Tax=Massilia solisilvae TaxID=1811225 RepID=A0ABT2BF89_9BURK|nr:acyltransferase [Massilia solisilvae]MCS0606750.1 acyltransferase [Massilia solisilvae]